jgi:glycosyltransferase involved in cell wall biosynthesis
MRLGQVDLFLPDDVPTRAPGRAGQLRYFGSHGLRYVRRWRELAGSLGDYDAVLVQRGAYAVGPGAVTRPLERFDGRLVFDLDDAVFELRPSLQGRPAPVRWLYGPQQAARILRRADAVVVSTRALARAIERPSVSPLVLPTILDPACYPLAEHSADARVVGWAGTNGGLGYLDQLRGVFEDLERREIGSLEVVSSRPWDGPSRFRQWRMDEESTVFSRFAVGIMPLPDTGYTRAKAGFKLLQYMAAGVPVVASPIGGNAELVEQSGAGLLAATPGEWSEALERLLGDPDLRREMGASGRAFVEALADLDGQADTLASLLEGREIATGDRLACR